MKKRWQISYRNDFPFLLFKDKCEEHEEKITLVSPAHESDAVSVLSSQVYTKSL